MNISKETISRLLKDVKGIMKNPNHLKENGIYYIHDEIDILKGYAMIVGPKDTPYFGGFYFFELNFPYNYPHSPPEVIFKTRGDNIRFNPNLYVDGKVCISILNTWRGDQWTSCITISTILLSLCSLLCSDPLLNEPGITNTHTDLLKYSRIIEYKNIDVCILKLITKDDNYFPKKFDIFYDVMMENFNKNNEEIIDFLNKKTNEQPHYEFIKINVYPMNVFVDYKYLEKSYLEYINKEKN
jgi:ubiquitin-conjugating enzyme E2 Z